MKTFIILLLSLSAISAQRYSPEEEYVSIDNALKSFSKIVIEYDEKLDRSAKFIELQAAIDAISASMQNYKGRAQNRLPLIKKYNTDAHADYTSCVGPVYEWCVSMNSTLDVFIKYIDEGMAVKDRRTAWNLAGRLLRQGLNKTTASLLMLGDVQKTMGYLETELKDLLTDINYDFSPDGEYGKIRSGLLDEADGLQDSERKEEQAQESARQAQTNRERALAQQNFVNRIKKAAMSLFASIFSVVITVVSGPIGRALGFPDLFAKSGLGHIINGNSNSNSGTPDPFDYTRSAALIHDYQKRRQVIDEQVRAIQLLFNALKEKTQEAVNIAGEVKTALEKEATHLRSLKGLIQAADTNRIALLSDNENLRRDLIPSFRNLGASCLQYAVRHGYSEEVSKSPITRRRRRAVKQCEENQKIYEEIFLKAMPFNATADENDQRATAKSIVQEMRCGTLFLLTANFNKPDTSANNDGKTGKIDDESESSSFFLALIKNMPKASHFVNM